MTPDAAPLRPLPADLRPGTGARGDVLPSTVALKADVHGATTSDVVVPRVGMHDGRPPAGGVPSADAVVDCLPDIGAVVDGLWSFVALKADVHGVTTSDVVVPRVGMHDGRPLAGDVPSADAVVGGLPGISAVVDGLLSAVALKVDVHGATVSDFGVLRVGVHDGGPPVGGVPSADAEAEKFPDGGAPTTAGRSGRASCVGVPRRSAWPGVRETTRRETTRRERTVGAGPSAVTTHRPLGAGVLHVGRRGERLPGSDVLRAAAVVDVFSDGSVFATAGRRGPVSCAGVPCRSARSGFSERPRRGRTAGVGPSFDTAPRRPAGGDAGTSAGVGVVREPLLSGARMGDSVGGGRLASDARRGAVLQGAGWRATFVGVTGGRLRCGGSAGDCSGGRGRRGHDA
ncbi:hypothetical protein AB0J72_39755 [Dactylosporangium sp. NPDC049742]|uniref:hypothetical protein n=1 Tax=Dactylosporangium sp. NPDC049742 TaxID=3154737 RepID=UPI003437AADD